MQPELMRIKVMQPNTWDYKFYTCLQMMINFQNISQK